MDNDELLFEKQEGLGLITFNRPKVHNALNDAAVGLLEAALDEVERDPDIRVLILTGAGSKSFVSGSDITELSTRTPLAGIESSKRRQALLGRLEGLRIPSIAAIGGYAFGVGCEIAMACSLRVASSSARMGQLEINLGIIPGAGGTQRLPRLVGKGHALELILTGKIVNANEAHRIGLVNSVVEPEELMNECRRLAELISQKSPVAVRYALRAVNEGLESNLAAGLKLEGLCLGACLASEDSKEGLNAFLERRKPEFKGR